MNIVGHDEWEKDITRIPNLRILVIFFPHVTLRDKRLGIARVSPLNSHPFSCLSSLGWRVYELQRIFISGSGLSWTCHGWPVMSVVSPDFYSATCCKCLLQQQQEEDRKHAQISHFSLKQLPELSSGFPYLRFTLDLPLLKNRFLLGAISSGKREERQKKLICIQVCIYPLFSYHQNPTPAALM